MHRNILPFVPYRFKGEDVACPVCASHHHRVVARFDRRLKPLKTVLCDECGVFYSNPMPTQNELSTYYRNEYRKDYQFARLKPSHKHVAKKKDEAKFRYSIIRQELTQDRLTLLDFGCGSGELVHEYAIHGHEAHGFEPGATYSDFAQKSQSLKITIQSIDYENAHYSPAQFDAITMLHVLEHIPHPLLALKKAHEWLKDDGILYIEVPNMQAYELKGFEHFHFAHVLGFSRDNLIHALRLAGFRIRRELGGTSLIAEKAHGQSCPATIDLAAIAQKNFEDYSAPISVTAYLAYHFKRMRTRLQKRRQKQAHAPSTQSGVKAHSGLQVPNS